LLAFRRASGRLLSLLRGNHRERDRDRGRSEPLVVCSYGEQEPTARRGRIREAVRVCGDPAMRIRIEKRRMGGDARFRYSDESLVCLQASFECTASVVVVAGAGENQHSMIITSCTDPSVVMHLRLARYGGVQNPK